MHKKLLCTLWFLVISSCATLSPSSQVDSVKATEESRIQILETNAAEAITAFEYSDNCTNVCWLGIHPGSTTVDEAMEILKSSEQISKDFFLVSDNEIRTNFWFIDGKKFKSHVFLTIDDGLIKSVSLTKPSVLRVKDIVNLLGEPDEIDINLFEHLHDEGLGVSYALYYLSQKVEVVIFIGNWNGPSPEDTIDAIQLSKPYNPANAQPWIGYGNLDKYLPGQELPTPYYLTPRSE